MTHLIPIGNSLGIRIPKAIIQQAGLENMDLDFKVTEKGLLIKPVRSQARAGWAEAFEKMQATADDKLLDEFQKNAFDLDEWQW